MVSPISLKRISPETLFNASEKYTFLVGAGISMNAPARVPSARQLIRTLFEYYAPNEDMDALSSLKELRYELVCEKIHEYFDPLYIFMDYFDLAEFPNLLHYFLAESIQNHHIVITTNFDYLIERALQGILPKSEQQMISPIITKRDFQSNANPLEIQKAKKWPVYKIHGSKRNVITGESTQESLISTISALGKEKENGVTFGIEPYKRIVLNALFKDRILVVMGYSGSDDFDIGPTLQKFSGFKKVIWLDHQPEDPLRIYSVEKIEDKHQVESTSNPIGLLMQIKLRAAIDVWYIETDTLSFVKSYLWPQLLRKPVLDEGKFIQSTRIIPTFAEWAHQHIATQPLEKKFRLALEIFHDTGHLDMMEKSAKRGLINSDPPTQAYLLLQLGVLASYKGDLSNALNTYQQSLKLCEQFSLFSDQVSNLLNIGSVYMNIGEFEQARGCYSQVQNLIEKITDSSLKSFLHTRLGDYFGIKHEFDEAQRQYEQALAIDEQDGNLNNKITNYYALGSLFLVQHQWDTAFQKFQEGIKIARQLGNEIAEAHLLVQIGIYYEIQNKIDECLTYYNQALDSYEKLQLITEIADTSKKIGETYYKQKNFDAARAYFLKALDIYQKQHPSENFAYLLRDLGSLLIEYKKYQEALTTYKQGLEIARVVHAKNPEAFLLNAMGLLLSTAGMQQEALACYHQALAIFKELKDTQAIATVKANIAKLNIPQ